VGGGESTGRYGGRGPAQRGWSHDMLAAILSWAPVTHTQGLSSPARQIHSKEQQQVPISTQMPSSHHPVLDLLRKACCSYPLHVSQNRWEAQPRVQHTSFIFGIDLVSCHVPPVFRKDQKCHHTAPRSP